MSFLLNIIYSNMYNLSINELCILRGNLHICPHNCIVCVRMVISFYPATRTHVHFSHEVRSFCATAASFRRWTRRAGPVVWAFLTVAYRWSRWDRSSWPSLSSLLRSKFYINLNLLGTSVSSLHHLRYRFRHFPFISGNKE